MAASLQMAGHLAIPQNDILGGRGMSIIEDTETIFVNKFKLFFKQRCRLLRHTVIEKHLTLFP